MTELAVDFGSELPASWTVAAIKEVVEISPKLDVSKLNDDHLVHFVPMAAVAEDFGGLDSSLLRPMREVRKGYTAFSEGDVLFAKITPCMENGKGAIVPKLPHIHAFGSTEFHVLRPGGAIADKWLAYYISQPDFRRVARQNMTGTAGQLRVPATWLSSAGLPLPPRAEQTRIVEKLEELLSGLDAGVAELKAAQRKLAQYRQSLLKAAMEGALTVDWRATHGKPQETGAELLRRILSGRRARWEQKQLAKFAEQGKTPAKGWQAKYPEPTTPKVDDLSTLPDGWTWANVDQLSPDDLANGRSGPTAEVGATVLRLTAVRGGKIDLSEWKYGAWSEEEAKPFAVTEGDLLVVRGNGSLALVGRAGLVGKVPDQVAYPDTLIRLRTIETVVRSAWMSLNWNSELSRNHLEKRARTSAGIYKISQPDIVSVRVPVPPLAEQDRILAEFDTHMKQIGSVEAALDAALKQATAQRKNLLKAAFAGHLVPQDPSDEPANELLARLRATREADGSGGKTIKRGRKAKETA